MLNRLLNRFARKNALAAAAAPTVEAMESRQMFSVGLEAGGTELVIKGTNAADTYDISLVNGKYQVRENGVLKSFAAGGIKLIRAYGAGGNDTIRSDHTVKIPSKIDAGAGDDVVRGGAGADAIFGGIGNDRIDGGLGKDFFHGGTGTDTADYSDRSTAVYVSIGSAAKNNDGAAGEGDEVDISIENITGGYGNDTLVGSAVRNILEGDHGVDTIRGGGGDDLLNGGIGNDKLFGEAGHDLIRGESGNDFISGGYGNDQLFGQSGNDALYGDDGNDTLEGMDGIDSFSGGKGTDVASYQFEPTAVFVTLDGVANDGPRPGGVSEGDNVWTDVENVVGGFAGDTLVGNHLNNRLTGGLGNDRIFGQGGNDSLFGDGGDDTLFGGVGVDGIRGGADDDTLVSVDGEFDIVLGQAGNDTFWQDTKDASDATAAEKAADRFHPITSYARGVSMAPLGQNLSDPSLAGYSAHYGKSFSDVKLFGTNGPQMSHVDQGSVGDCHFLAGLAGVADAKPDLIRQSIAELGDGTYVVRMYKGSTPVYYRVDGQLPLSNGDGKVMFARPDDALWAPLMEKAFAFHDAGGKYKDLEVGWGDAGFLALGKTSDQDEVIWHWEEDMAKKMRDHLTKGGAVTFTTGWGVTGLPLYAFHVYTVADVASDLKTITIRNPWGHDDAYDKHGSNDGVFKISISTLDDGAVWINHSRL